jgi:DNA-binding transcriptional regulator YiaG
MMYVDKLEVKAARAKAGHTPTEAGATLGKSYRTWHKWEGGECRMERIALEYYRLLTVNAADALALLSGLKAARTVPPGRKMPAPAQ